MFGTDIPEAWVDYADRNYTASRLLWFTDLMLDAPVSAHRAIELHLKAYLVSKGVTIQKGESAWGHDLINLRTLCAEYDPVFAHAALSRRVGYYQRYFDLVRYPTEIEGNLPNGTGIWFSIDSVILPLDEVVAFVRPRVVLSEDSWTRSCLTRISSDPDRRWPYQQKALMDENRHIDAIVCTRTNDSSVKFDPNFTFDLPGC